MLQENYSHDPQTQYNESQTAVDITNNSHTGFAIEGELDRLKELILSSSHIPLTELAIVDRELLLEQILQIQENLPIELGTAVEIVNRRQEIIADAQGYACLIVKSAEEKAHQIVQESAILRQAELDAAKIRLRIEQECEQLQQATKTEVARLKQNAIAECQDIEEDVDLYADRVLKDLEERLAQMLTIVQNGRQQLDL
ncbi:hypothetical protein I4641_00035 [Waterburya agarophytonicola K14]|uniref:DivIVA domain-containing protein n=1 Tax=Waterburya agarophytonicola KI4 TaxID=2874699 RepID=A0A964BL22_9CYAN|nr:DivIVA domain-containing protein [Waterburya agarophytonicola]MCC0175368.1 hypothetical protein [Waterburya agarophytonicola KI4]